MSAVELEGWSAVQSQIRGRILNWILDTVCSDVLHSVL